MAYSVTRRTHEIGIRMPLGAAHADVIRMVLRQGAKLTLLGVMIGLAAAFGATRLIDRLLFVSPTDGWAFAGVTMLLAAVAMIASFLPAGAPRAWIRWWRRGATAEVMRARQPPLRCLTVEQSGVPADSI